MIRVPRLVAAIALGAVAGTAAAQAPAWADPAKVLRVMMPIAETGFDPQAVSDLYSAHINRAMFETLFNYDYLARPYKLVPNTAASMPEISADGRVWTIRLKPGIRFADDPAFKGKPRELTAHDYVYAWKRLLDSTLLNIRPRRHASRGVEGAREMVGAQRGTRREVVEMNGSSEICLDKQLHATEGGRRQPATQVRPLRLR